MICWSCQKEMPDGAEFCPHCEAEAMDELSGEAKAVVQSMLAGMSHELIEQLSDTFEKSSSGEDFVNRIMVGECPKCGSSHTGDCDNDPDIADPCVGRCLECGQLWCCDCGELLQNAQKIDHDCPVWEGMGLDDDDAADSADEGLEDEDLEHEDLDDVDLEDVDLEGVDLEGVDFDDEELDDEDLDDEDLGGVDLGGVDLGGVDLEIDALEVEDTEDGDFEDEDLDVEGLGDFDDEDFEEEDFGVDDLDADDRRIGRDDEDSQRSD